jgi:hypothetical protein
MILFFFPRIFKKILSYSVAFIRFEKTVLVCQGPTGQTSSLFGTEALVIQRTAKIFQK